ncbi:MAG: sulfotransferase [bacterium]
MLPDLVIIGAMKCGTSSLRRYLDQHPDIAMAPGGLNFFSAEHNWSKGRAWYEAQFSGAARLHGDTSPRYSNYPTQGGVAQRMAGLIPHAKLLYLVRDPLERLISHYLHFRAEGLETRSLDEALQPLDGNDYVGRGLYHLQLEQFLPAYADALLIVFHEDLRDRRLPTLRRIFTFLGVDASLVSDAFDIVHHRTADKFAAPTPRPPIPAAILPALKARFAPDIARLAALTGRDLRHWCA